MAQGRIRVLPPEVAGKISAGEVVERPASAVKELLENSVDAGASKITVEIKKGGSELIRVSDDGCGMNRADALLSLERHSTSKLRDESGIGHVVTLGFRGEALPSIASVSKFRMSTRPADEETGVIIEAEGGRIRREEITARPPGTEIRVEHLFFNTPARRKFLKSPSTETSHINNIACAQAAACLQIHFELVHNGRLFFRLPRAGSLRERVLGIFGSELENFLIDVEKEKNGVRVSGVISAPGYTRTQGNRMLFFVNGRPVRSRIFTHALLESYRPLIPGDRFPFSAIFLEIDPQLVDVNIHPRKTEVKFMEPGAIHGLLGLAAEEALNSREPEKYVFGGAAPKQGGQSGIFEAVRRFTSTGADFQPAFEFAPGRLPDAAGAPSHLFQAQNSYIVAEDKCGLIIIDQHAAHERILYEKLKKHYSEGFIPAQRLLAPHPCEFSAGEAAFIEDNLELLGKSGFTAEPFGQNSFILRTIPAELKKADPGRLFSDVVSDLMETGICGELKKNIDRIICSSACRGAVMAGDRLGPDEMRWIVAELFRLDQPHSCPHGRPAVIRLDFSEIARKFKR